jgi:hypothetical protein
MMKLTKSLLVISLLCLVVGFLFVGDLVNAHNSVVLYAVLPTGAVFLGLFLICLLLEKETAQYDADRRTLLAAAESAATSTDSGSKKSTQS